MRAVAVVVLAYLAGAVPFSNLVARRIRNVDLRGVGEGTVSGTSLYHVAGFGPLAFAGVLEVAKGALGPALAGHDHPVVAAVAGGAAVAGHNWSPFLRGAGGRGLSPALGALLVLAWPGTVLLLLGMVLGRFARQTGLGSFLSELALTPVLGGIYGGRGTVAGAAVTLPLLAKRLLGNRAPAGPDRGRVYLSRLVFDRDPRS